MTSTGPQVGIGVREMCNARPKFVMVEAVGLLVMMISVAFAGPPDRGGKPLFDSTPVSTLLRAGWEIKAVMLGDRDPHQGVTGPVMVLQKGAQAVWCVMKDADAPPDTATPTEQKPSPWTITASWCRVIQ